MALNERYSYPNDYTVECTFRIGDKDFYGVAKCHPEDVYSKRVGERVACDRAQIAAMCDERDNTVTQLRILKHLKSIYDQTDKADSAGYEYQMLVRQIRKLEEDLAVYRYIIKGLKENSKEYVKGYAKLLKR